MRRDDKFHAMALLRLRTFQQRLIALGVVLAVIPLMALSLIFEHRCGRLAHRFAQDRERLAAAALDDTVILLEAAGASAGEAMESRIRLRLEAASRIIASRGGVDTVPGWYVTRESRDIASGRQMRIKAPVMVVGEPSNGPDSLRRLQREIQEAVAAQVIVFQRIQSTGGGFVTAAYDEAERSRPTGPSSLTLAGDEFIGRFQLWGQSMIGGSRPLRNAKGSMIGALLIFEPEPACVASALSTLNQANSVHSGRAAVRAGAELRTSGDEVSGRLMEEGQKLAPGRTAHFRSGGLEYAVRYLPRWDWLVVASAPIEDIGIPAHSTQSLVFATLAAALASLFGFQFVTRRFTRRMHRLTAALLRMADALEQAASWLRSVWTRPSPTLAARPSSRHGYPNWQGSRPEQAARILEVLLSESARMRTLARRLSEVFLS